MKLVLNRIANAGIRFLFQHGYNDTTNAFKAYRRHVIDQIHPLLSNHFNLTVEMPLKAIVRGYNFAVVPVSWTNRQHGVSKLRLQEMGSRYAFIILYVWLEHHLSRGDYRRKDLAAGSLEQIPPRARTKHTSLSRHLSAVASPTTRARWDAHAHGLRDRVLRNRLRLCASSWSGARPASRPGVSASSATSGTSWSTAGACRPSVLLTPHGPHLSLLPILVYKVLLQLFGASSYLPFRLLAAFDLVLLCPCRSGGSLESIGGGGGRSLPSCCWCTLGPGGSSLLWPFQVGYAISVAAGVVAWWRRRRGDPRADFVAFAALIVSLASASQGVGFVVGIAVVLFLRGNWRGRAWVPVVPAILYGLWYLKYGHQYSETHLSLWTTSLSYSAQSLSATFAPLLGLSSVSSQTGLLDITFGVPVALAAIAAVGYACWRGWRPPALFWGAAATLLVLWVAASLSNTPASTGLRPTRATRPRMQCCPRVPMRRPAAPELPVRGVDHGRAAILAIVAATNASQYSQRARRCRPPIRKPGRARRAAAHAGSCQPSLHSVPPGRSRGPCERAETRASFFSFVDAFGAITDSPARSRVSRRPRARRSIASWHAANFRSRRRPQPRRPHRSHPPSSAVPRRPSGSCLVLGSGPLVIRASPQDSELTRRRQAR